MAQKKAHEVDGWLAKPDDVAKVVLIYGPDRGLVSERAHRFAASTGLPLDDPFTVIRIDASALADDPGRLVDEIRTVPMFADQRLVWVTGAGAEKPFADAVAQVLADPPTDALLLVEAGELRKNAQLRTSVESARSGIALPCYADDARALDALIQAQLAEAGLSISTEAREALKAGLGGDRMASRAEIEKLILYCRGNERIELADIREATGDAAGLSLDDVVDAVLDGRPAEFDIAFSRLVAAGTAPFLLLNAAMRQFQALQAMRNVFDRERKPASAVIAAARPPVFFTRRRLMEKAVQNWTADACARILDRINGAVLETRQRPDLAEAATRQALLAAAITGARAGR
ncbi:MAG: DNA polymerase III subunit delta [Rhizobiaceae bacterium]|nr:DNA polymerase III subunit delta [Rhizobiaceae bacterium]